MVILHVIPHTIFIVNYIKGFQGCPEGEKHLFYIYGSQKNKETQKIYFEENDNIILDSQYTYSRFNYIYKGCDICVVQCIPENLSMCKMLYDCYVQSEKPLIIVPWGRELFNESDLYRSENQELIEKIDFYKNFLIQNCKYMIMSAYAYQYVKDTYHVNCKYAYFNPLNTFSVSDYQGTFEKKNEKFGIMIGHRGTITGGHIEVITQLSLYKNQQMNIFCPLVYGNKEYIDVVKKKGKELLNENFIALTEWMDKNAYYDFLVKNVDVAVFNNNSSEGANTIFFLIYAGKKLYINRNNEIYWILKDLGITFYEWTKYISKEQLQKPLNEQQRKCNRKKMEEFGSENMFKYNWSKVFHECYAMQNTD